MDELKIFQNEKFGKIRVVMKDGEAWFIANDACKILEIANSRDALDRLDEDEKGVALTDTLGGKQELNVVNEPGLYSLVFKSRKPEAKAFKRWITHEVLPSIRATGSYSTESKREKYKQQSAELRKREANIREANMYYKLADKFPYNSQYRQALYSKAVEVLAGEKLTPDTSLSLFNDSLN